MSRRHSSGSELEFAFDEARPSGAARANGRAGELTRGERQLDGVEAAVAQLAERIQDLTKRPDLAAHLDTQIQVCDHFESV